MKSQMEEARRLLKLRAELAEEALARLDQQEWEYRQLLKRYRIWVLKETIRNTDWSIVAMFAVTVGWLLFTFLGG